MNALGSKASPLRYGRWTSVALICAGFLAAQSAFGAPKDGAATKLASEALNDDYLSLRFDDAVKKLRRALAVCGASGCSREVRARVHRDLGVVLVAGQNRPSEGKSEFVEALRSDPRVALDQDLSTPEIERVFQAAKAGGSASSRVSAGAGPSAGASDVVHEPPAEQMVLTPVPIFIQVPASMSPAKVLLLYKPFGTTDWQKLELHAMGRGFGGEVPCPAVSTTGELSYYIQVMDHEGDVITTSGSRSAPNKVPVRNSIAIDPPHLPDRAPPLKCRDKADCPPGFPGCSAVNAKTRSDAKGWGRSCEIDRDCDEGLACKAGKCERGEKLEVSSDSSSTTTCDSSSDCAAGEVCETDRVCAAPARRFKRTWLTFQVEQDFSMFSAQRDVCGSPSYETPPDATCVTDNGARYAGIPSSSDTGAGNEVSGGFRRAAVRLSVGASYFVARNLSLDAKVGYGLENPPRGWMGNARGEVRVAYWLGGNALASKTVRFYAALLGGIGEMHDRQEIQVSETMCRTNLECQMPQNRALGLSPSPTITVWRRAGIAFAGGALGVMVPTASQQAIVAELEAKVFFPTRSFSVAPSIGYAFGL